MRTGQGLGKNGDRQQKFGCDGLKKEYSQQNEDGIGIRTAKRCTAN